MAHFKDYTTICNSAPSEFLGTLALRNKETLLKRNRELIQKNLKGLDSFFKEFQEHFTWARPQAGCIAFPCLTNQDSTRFCENLLGKTGILLAPGSKFGYDDRYFRLGFGRKNCPEIMEILSKYLNPSKTISPLHHPS
jgi:aspartate/methionine/tyrosine aminotransferase